MDLTALRSAPTAIKNKGQIIGVCRDTGGNDHQVLWQNGTVTTLGMLGGLQVTAVSAINNGQIAATANNSATVLLARRAIWARVPIRGH